MRYKLALVAALGLTTAASAATPEDPETIYLVHMYTDASHTQEVGYLSGQCMYAPGLGGYYVQYTQHGTYTYYTYDEPVGSCPDVLIL